ncbi:hypothetical protein PROFUN_07609 [Planoprotostelium fungivorum]|uniref:Uncharacterized protein n=1 Tax=Planoprotostelium fungivorum TaxID=1890364 RepID=A0A2P6NK12_9EUKA|nr:hypothetical protein PROFUN_07609 [Planoprotostelium fungivorum]
MSSDLLSFIPQEFQCTQSSPLSVEFVRCSAVKTASSNGTSMACRLLRQPEMKYSATKPSENTPGVPRILVLQDPEWSLRGVEVAASGDCPDQSGKEYAVCFRRRKKQSLSKREAWLVFRQEGEQKRGSARRTLDNCFDIFVFHLDEKNITVTTYAIAMLFFSRIFTNLSTKGLFFFQPFGPFVGRKAIETATPPTQKLGNADTTADRPPDHSS